MILGSLFLRRFRSRRGWGSRLFPSIFPRTSFLACSLEAAGSPSLSSVSKGFALNRRIYLADGIDGNRHDARILINSLSLFLSAVPMPPPSFSSLPPTAFLPWLFIYRWNDAICPSPLAQMADSPVVSILPDRETYASFLFVIRWTPQDVRFPRASSMKWTCFATSSDRWYCRALFLRPPEHLMIELQV